MTKPNTNDMKKGLDNELDDAVQHEVFFCRH